MRTLVVVALLMAACGGADTSTPDGCAQAFIEMAQDQDVSGLGKIMAKTCGREFKAIVDGSVSKKMMEELAKMFDGAEITDTKVTGNTAKVHVKLPNHRRGKETLNMVKEGDEWRLEGF